MKPTIHPLVRDGQGLTEFSLVIPLLLLVVLGIVELARLTVGYISTVSASREGARFGVAVAESPVGIPHYQDCDGIRSAAQRVSPLTPVSVSIFYDPDGPGGTAPIPYCPVGTPVDPITADLGGRIIVRASSQYTPLFGLVNLPTIPLTSETRRTIIKEVFVR